MEMLLKSRLCLETQDFYIINEKFKYKKDSFSLFSKNPQKKIVNKKKDPYYNHDSIIKCYICKVLKSIYKTPDSTIEKKELYEKTQQNTKKYFIITESEFEKSLKKLIDMEYIECLEDEKYGYLP